MRPPSVLSVATNDNISISPPIKGQAKNNLLNSPDDGDGKIFNKAIQLQQQQQHQQQPQQQQQQYQHQQQYQPISHNKQNVDFNSKKNCSNHDNFINHLTKSISKNHSIIINPLSDKNNCATSSSDYKLKRNTSDLEQYYNLSETDHDNFIIKNKKTLSDYTISTNKKNIIVNKLSEIVHNTNTTNLKSSSTLLYNDPEKKPLLINKNSDNVIKNCDIKNKNSVDNFVQRRLKNKQNLLNRRSLQNPVGYKSEDNSNEFQSIKRRQQIHSWYAPGYEILTEVSEQETRENVSFFNNLAGARGSLTNGTLESASLLDNQSNNQITTIQPQRSRRSDIYISSQQNLQSEGPHASSFGGPSQPTRRVGKFLKSLYSRNKTIKDNNFQTSVTPSSLISSSEFKDQKIPSEKNLTNLTQSSRRGVGNSTASLNVVNQKIWSYVPLLRRENSCSSLNQTTKTKIYDHNIGLRKCNTVLALSQSTSSSTSSGIEPIKPLNRLRNYTSIGTCSRCSSILSLAAAGSKYSLNISSGGGFVAIDGNDGEISNDNKLQSIAVSCKLCLGEVKSDKITKISHCGCSFCTECMTAYVEFEILEGAYEISCPDAMCPSQGILTVAEIMLLASNSLMEKHQRYRLNREVELDINRTWCPKAGCETVCLVGPSSAEKAVTIQPSSSQLQAPCAVHCPTCEDDFCSGCKKAWHPTMSCEENLRRLAADGIEDLTGIPFDSDLIKCCPMCSVPIEKDEGCAQMMCKRCKHVFCWYCLASLDDDFLLRHYDKGPCKNKLGHSRASVVWHRAQVIGIFAGFGILLLVASPLLLLAAPCIVCCKCRICSGAAKLDENEHEYDDIGALQR